MGLIISIANHKGGVSKTTSTVNIGAALASLGRKVLLLDMDSQANLTSALLQEEPEFDESLAYYIPKHARVDKGEVELKRFPIIKNLDLIASDPGLASAELNTNDKTGKESILKRLLRPYKEQYDYIVIDCPPSVDFLTTNAFIASDYVVMPLLADKFSVRGVRDMMDFIEEFVENETNPKLKVLGVFFAIVENNTNLSKDCQEYVENTLKDAVFKTRVRKNISLSEAHSSCMDIFRYNKKSTGASDYAALAQEIELRVEELNK